MDTKGTFPDGVLNRAVAPLGSPVTVRVTDLSNPPTGLTETLKLAFSPCFTIIEAGDPNTEKSWASLTVKVIVLELVA